MTDGGERYGGERSIGAVAEDSGYSTRTVYRAVKRLSSVIETHLGDVRFKSQYRRERALETLRSLRDGLASEDDEDEPSSAWARFCAKYGVEVEDPADARLRLRLGVIPEGRSFNDMMKDLYFSYRGPNREFRFKNALIEYERGGRSCTDTGFTPR